MIRASRIFVFAAMLALSAGFLFPVFIVFTNSFMGSFEIFNRYTHLINPGNVLHATEDSIHFVRFTLIPDFATVQQYASLLFSHPRYLGRFWNSVALALPIVLGQALISAPAAYAFEMSRFRFKEAVYFVYITVMLMPLQVVLVPHFLVADWFGLLNSRLAIILPGIINPFGVFLMRQFMRGLPKEYIEAAQIDGLGHLRIIPLVIAPLFKPAFAALMILTFVENWNLVEQPMIFLQESQEPLSVYLAQMAGENLNMIFAASFFYLIPTVLVFLYGQENMVEAIQLSGIK